jgi:hypothetical protein
LTRTLAPFVNSRKPQVFPWAAASFINKVPQISKLSPIGTNYCTARNNLRQTSERQMYLYLLGIFDESGTTRATNPQAKTRCPLLPDGDKRAPLTFAAGLVGTFDLESTVTILQQDFWGFRPGTGPNEAQGTHRPKVAPERITPDKCQRVGQTLALFPYLRRTLN